ATGAADGTSWTDAFTDLRDALLNVNHNQEVWVAAGTYTPTNGSTRTETFKWTRDSIRLYGGFDGTETSLTQRDWKNNPTILSGDVGIPVDFTDNSFTVLQGPVGSIGSVISYAKIDGLTITNGFANASFDENRFGGGAYFSGYTDRIDIENCTFIQNGAEAGGGLQVVQDVRNMEVNVVNCVFHENRSRWSAGLGVSATDGNTELVVNLVGCTFSANEVVDGIWSGQGTTGIIYAFSTGTLTFRIANCTFADNLNPGSGIATEERTTILYYKTSSADLRLFVDNSIFWNNDAEHEVLKNLLANSIDADSAHVRHSIADSPKFGASIAVSNVDSMNPMFVDAANFDYDLQISSPAINQGDTAHLTNVLPALDPLGRVRIFGTVIDLGAFESTVPLAIAEAGLNQALQLFPNPATSHLNWTLHQPVRSLTVMDAFGRTLISKTNPSESTLDLNHLAPGTYFVRVETDAQIHTGRFTKQ
ncbi:MAG: T9SS type A sorting domain-containing protein, partial [Bacteroidota bacterium]